MLALVDADSLIYRVACAIEEKTIWNEAEFEAGLEDELIVTYETNIKQAKSTVDGLIENILFATGCDGYELWLTGKTNFRDDNPLGYKANRKDIRRPEGYSEIKQHLIDKHGAKLQEGLEADDIVVYLKTTYPDDYILCAIDKDVLLQTVGTHYNYGNDTEVTVNEVEAIRFAYYQTLVGDPVDGYKGCPGIGKVKGGKLLNDLTDESEMWSVVVETYEKKGLTIDDAINTMRLANMHQWNGKKVVYWTPPETPSIGA